MAAPTSLDRRPALPTDPVAPPHIADHPHLPGDDIRDGRDGLASAPSPQPAPGAASPATTTPDPAATCGMPDRPLQPPASPLLARRGAGGEDSPLADRCWDLFCQGHSFAAIGRTLGLHRETAARHVKAIHQQVQADRRADRALALSRALATQERIQATAWTLLAQAQAQATAQETTPSPSSAPSASSVVKASSASLADCARLLTLILASAREAARLDLLYDRDAPARKADQDDKPKAIRLIIERVGDPYVDPTQPASAPAQPPASPSSPPANAGANAGRPFPAPTDPADDPAARTVSSNSPGGSAASSGLPAEFNSASLPLPPDSPIASPADSSSAAYASAASPAPTTPPAILDPNNRGAFMPKDRYWLLPTVTTPRAAP